LTKNEEVIPLTIISSISQNIQEIKRNGLKCPVSFQNKKATSLKNLLGDMSKKYYGKMIPFTGLLFKILVLEV
jgi:hypothetical protein